MQLNPGGTLNHKYTGETAVRGSGLPYSVLRSTGMPLTTGQGSVNAPGHQHFQVYWEPCLLLRLYTQCM